MNRESTKDPYERETEEAERLVRPAPKIKPPRHDRSRETTHPDKDPDTDSDKDTKQDTDKSRNYKDIGGSVLRRHLLAQKVFQRVAEARPDLITVRLKSDPEKTVNVTKETLKKEPGKYEKMEEGEDKGKEEKPKSDPYSSYANNAYIKKRFPETIPEESFNDQIKRKPRDEPDLEGVENSEAAKIPTGDFKAFMQGFEKVTGKKGPEAEKAADELLEQVKAGKAEPPIVGTHFQEGGTHTRFLIQGDDVALAYRYLGKPIPTRTISLKGTHNPHEEALRLMEKEKEKGGESSEESSPKGSEESQEKTPEGSEETSPKGKKKPPKEDQPKRRKTTDFEDREAYQLTVDTFPPDIASSILAQGLHPDDVHTLVQDYHAAMSQPVRSTDVAKFAEETAKFYQTDPNKVPPPKTFPGPDGKEVPFDQASPEEQKEALQRHKLQTVALSLAAHTQLTKTLGEKSGAPKDLAKRMATALLSKKDDPGEVTESFHDALRNANTPDTKPVSDSAIKKILKSAPTPEAKKIAVGHFQGQDYQEARKRFLGPDGFNETHEPKDIAKGIIEAKKFFGKRSKLYQNVSTDMDPWPIFRTRVLGHLKDLSPEKYPEIQKALDEEENDSYEKDLTKFKKDQAKHKAEVAKLKTKFEAMQNPPKEQKVPAKKDPAIESQLAKLKEDYEKSKPKTFEEFLAENGTEEPQKPKKPPRYDVQRKPSEELAEDAKKDRQKFMDRLASRVFSTYQKATSMKSKEAVYWGVAPYKDTQPYEGWNQAQARDLGEGDYNAILASAKDWLKNPVLNCEGYDARARFGAALDLAIRDLDEGIYSSGLHPTVYNKLLARLSGSSSSQVKASAESTYSLPKEEEFHMMPKFATKEADQVLARLDRIAATIQANAKSWGMPFEAARSMVNALDKTADEIEAATFGDTSLLARQAEVLNITAKVIQRDADEGYMDTFSNPMAPIQVEADEPYMSAYGLPDQSSDVQEGKSTSGRPLAP